MSHRATYYPALLFLALLFASVTSAEPAKVGLIKKLTDKNGAVDLGVTHHAALYVEANQSASPFITPGPISAELSGILTLSNRERVYFSFVGTGKATLEIDGEVVLTASGMDLSQTETERLRLNSGEHSIKITYDSPKSGAAKFRLQWRGRGFASEPVPASRFTHESTSELEQSLHRQHGRSLFGQLRCVNCHQAPLGDAPMQETTADAPSFAGIGDRLKAGWIKKWLLDPTSLRHNAEMPKIAGINESEANDLATALASMKTNDKKAAETPLAGAQKGGGLFHRYGCANCHTPPSIETIDPKRTPLHAVAAKFNTASLADFLQTPNKHYAWIKMPNFGLNKEDAEALSAFLIKQSATKSFPLPDGDLKKGNALLKELNCAACHGGTAAKATPALPVVKLDPTKSGCISSNSKGKSPSYSLSDAERQALKAFLKAPTAASQSLAKHNAAQFAERQLKQLNCNACHEIDGQSAKWGTDHEITLAHFKASGLKEAHLDQSRPDLNQVGAKLNTDYLTRVLAGQAETSRPWLDARMPAFPARANALAKGLAARQGFAVSTADSDNIDPKLATIGRGLASSNGGFACNICHATGDAKALAAFEVEGINLARINERLRPGFFLRWMHNPPRITPTTKMPRYALEDGTTALSGILDGDADAQFKAIWEYLKAGKENPTIEMKLEKDGVEIHKSVLDADTLEALRQEALLLASTEGSACVRQACTKSAMFRQVANTKEIYALLRPNLILVRSILFDKTAASNWPVSWHQDLTIAVKKKVEMPEYGPWSVKEGHPHVQPPASLLASMITLRIHLDDTPAENGALRVILGSHAHGKLNETDIQHLLRDRSPQTCACGPGDILVMSPLILHASSRSKNPHHRRILHLEFAEKNALPAQLSWASSESH